MNFFTGLTLEKREYSQNDNRSVHYKWKNSFNEIIFHAGAQIVYANEIYDEVSHVWIDVCNFPGRRFYFYDSEKDTLPRGMSSFMDMLEDEEYLSHRLYNEFTSSILEQIRGYYEYLSRYQHLVKNEDVEVFCDFIINQMPKDMLENLLVKIDKRLEYL